MRVALLAALAAPLAVAAPAAAAPHLVDLGTFSAPTYVTGPPGDPSRVFVVEQRGRIQLLHDGVRHEFLDLTGPTRSAGAEQGLLSMAFAPDYAASGRFFVYLTRNPDGAIEVREYRRSAADPDRADPAPVATLLTIPHPTYPNHNGGQLQIGPDGLLWIGTGDGGGSNDVNQNAQDLDSELGKILRVNLDGSVPADNFHGRTWAYGLRNPWRFSFDRQTGDLVIADVGQSAREEVDVAEAPGRGRGVNWGWPCFEGTRVNTAAQDCTGVSNTAPPRLERRHAGDGFCSITGGYVVRDPLLPTLAGRYLFGDFCAADTESFVLGDPRGATGTGLRVPQLTSFGEDACGRVYAASRTNVVYRIDDQPGSTCPAVTPSPGDAGAPGLHVRLRGGRRLGPGHRRLTVAASCDEPCGLTVRARLPGIARLTRPDADAAAATQVELRPKLSRAEARRLRRARRDHRVLLKVTVHATDAAGNDTADTRRKRLPRR